MPDAARFFTCFGGFFVNFRLQAWADIWVAVVVEPSVSDNSSSPYFTLGRSRIKFTTNEKRIRNHLVIFSQDFVPFDWYINTRTSLVCIEGKIERSPIARL